MADQSVTDKMLDAACAAKYPDTWTSSDPQHTSTWRAAVRENMLPCLEAALAVQQAEVGAERDRLHQALVEIDTYLAHDPDVWRIVSVCKAGDVLCDALGGETILAINANVEALLCPSCAAELPEGTKA